MYENKYKLILASTSPFRAKLLWDAGLEFKVEASAADEHTIQGLPPSILARKRAVFKGMEVANRTDAHSIVIGADQVLSLDGKAFDKAHSSEEAARRLAEFAGQTHFLHSAFCFIVVGPDGNIVNTVEHVVDVPMTMRALSPQEIDAYVATNEWQGCVGCYRIEGAGRALFSKIHDDQSAIIGLPIGPLVAGLKDLRLLVE